MPGLAFATRSGHFAMRRPARETQRRIHPVAAPPRGADDPMRRLGCILAAVLVLSSTACRSADVTIDYNRNIRRLSPLAIGMAETGWRSPNALANDARERRRLARLDLGYIR